MSAFLTVLLVAATWLGTAAFYVLAGVIGALVLLLLAKTTTRWFPRSPSEQHQERNPYRAPESVEKWREENWLGVDTA